MIKDGAKEIVFHKTTNLRAPMTHEDRVFCAQVLAQLFCLDLGWDCLELSWMSLDSVASNARFAQKYFSVQYHCPRRGVKFGENMYSSLHHL